MLNNGRGSARYSSPDPAFYAGGMPDDLQPDAGSGNKSIKRATASFSSTSLRQPFCLQSVAAPGRLAEGKADLYLIDFLFKNYYS